MTYRDAEALAVLLKGFAFGGLIVGFGGLVIYSSFTSALVSVAVAVALTLASKFVLALAEEAEE